MSGCNNGLPNCITPLPMDASGKLSDYEFLCWVNQKLNQLASDLEEIKSQYAVVDRLNNGILGNSGYNASDSPYPNAYLINPNGLINHRTEQTVTESSGEGEIPIIVTQKILTYEDSEPTANENFKLPTNILSDYTLNGYSANTEEASTQNFTGIVSYVKSNMAGIVGVTGYHARLYMPAEEDNPLIFKYGAPKGGGYDAYVSSPSMYENGGYALGMELDIIDTCSQGTFPVYQNSDLGIYKKRTHGLIIAGGGDTQPITNAIQIQKLSNQRSGFWNGIVIGATCFNFDGEPGYYGTTGINMASWRTAAGYPYYGIKMGTAKRNMCFTEGCKYQSDSTNFFPYGTTSKVNDKSVYVRLVSTGAGSYLQFTQSDDLTLPDPNFQAGMDGTLYTQHNGMRLNSNSGEFQIRIYDKDTSSYSSIGFTTGNIYDVTAGKHSIGYDAKYFRSSHTLLGDTIHQNDSTISNENSFDSTVSEALRSVQPKRYIVTGQSKTHYGYNANDIANALTAAGIQISSCGILSGDETTYGIKYNELITALLQLKAEYQVYTTALSNIQSNVTINSQYCTRVSNMLFLALDMSVIIGELTQNTNIKLFEIMPLSNDFSNYVRNNTLASEWRTMYSVTENNTTSVYLICGVSDSGLTINLKVNLSLFIS